MKNIFDVKTSRDLWAEFLLKVATETGKRLVALVLFVVALAILLLILGSITGYIITPYIWHLKSTMTLEEQDIFDDMFMISGLFMIVFITWRLKRKFLPGKPKKW